MMSVCAVWGRKSPMRAEDIVSRTTSGKLNAFHSSEDSKGLSADARSFLVTWRCSNQMGIGDRQ